MRANRILLFASVVVLSGCVNYRAKMLERAPEGYLELIKIQPACESPSLSAGELCVAAAEILEAPLRRVVPLALASWRNTIRQLDAEIQRAVRNGDAITAGVMANGREDAIVNIEAIVIAAARTRIERSVRERDVYALYVYPAFESIVVGSIESADSMQRAHEDGVRQSVSAGGLAP